MLKSIYEISLSYGYDYNDEQEKHFILILIQVALLGGDEFKKINDKVDFYIKNGFMLEDVSI